MPVYNGQAVDEAVTNPAFLDAQVDDTAAGKLTLANTDPLSGPFVTNIQAGHNASFQDLKIFICTTDHSRVTFSMGQLVFTNDILVVSRDYLITNTIAAVNSPLNIADGESVYITLSRMANATILPVVTSILPKGQNIFRLCTRRGDGLIFWDNTLLMDGKSMRIGESVISTGAVQETPAGVVDGVNASFTLTSIPPTAAATMIFIDGMLIAPSEYTLLNNVVIFGIASIPQPSQTVSAFYLAESSAAPGPAPTGLEYVEYPILTAPQVAAKQLTLIATPATPLKVMVDLIGGCAQVFGVDFTVAGNVLSWNGLGLDGVLVTGDQIRVHYFT